MFLLVTYLSNDDATNFCLSSLYVHFPNMFLEDPPLKILKAGWLARRFLSPLSMFVYFLSRSLSARPVWENREEGSLRIMPAEYV